MRAVFEIGRVERTLLLNEGGKLSRGGKGADIYAIFPPHRTF